MITAKILADSRNTETNDRLTTFELTYPRFVHAQLMTHRMFSRNAASSRAIPTEKLMRRITTDPVQPVYWGANQRGMQAHSELSREAKHAAIKEWFAARMSALKHAQALADIGVHKQIVNRILEPWMYITTIVSATEYANFFHLRGADAQPEIEMLAKSMKICMEDSTPKELIPGEWHLPLVETEDSTSPLYIDAFEQRALGDQDLRAISTARCARVSYLTHDGERSLEADLDLHERLAKSGHWSPFEHPAMATSVPEQRGNFFGFVQYRKFFKSENFGREMK